PVSAMVGKSGNSAERAAPAASRPRCAASPPAPAKTPGRCTRRRTSGPDALTNPWRPRRPACRKARRRQCFLAPERHRGAADREDAVMAESPASIPLHHIMTEINGAKSQWEALIDRMSQGYGDAYKKHD